VSIVEAFTQYERQDKMAEITRIMQGL